MTNNHFKFLYILKNKQIPLEERFDAVMSIAREVAERNINAIDIPRFYQPMIEFWRSFGLSKIDRDNEVLFDIRKKLANLCLRLSLHLPEGQKFFKYFPMVKKAEGFKDCILNTLMVGEIKPRYGTSIYEFHWEYPIEGFGIKKDLISVIIHDNQRIPMLDWCKQNDIIVFCNSCGLDITYEVSRDCPFTNRR